MADIKIVKIKIRRGTNSQRKSTILDQGELGFTTDTKRLYIGNGVLSGGLSLSTKVHTPLTNYASLSNTSAETGDLAIANNLFYQLTGTDSTVITNWAFVGTKIDTSFFEYTANNTVTLKDDSITPVKLNAASLGDGIIVNGGLLETDINVATLVMSAGQVAVKDAGIGEHQLASSAFTNGISGGNGGKIGIKFDATTMYLKFGDTLAISAFPAESVTFSSLDSAWIGAGLIYDLPNQQIKSVLTDVDTTSLSKDLSGRVRLQSGLMSATNELPYIRTDTYGRVLINTTSIYDTLTCIGHTDVASPLSSLFNGTPIQSLSGSIPGIQLTTFTVISSNATGGNATLTLSSAGFIVFQGGVNTRQDGKYLGRFAIPVFAY